MEEGERETEREGVVVDFNFSITLTFILLIHAMIYQARNIFLYSIQTRIEVTNIIFRFHQKIHLGDWMTCIRQK